MFVQPGGDRCKTTVILAWSTPYSDTGTSSSGTEPQSKAKVPKTERVV